MIAARVAHIALGKSELEPMLRFYATLFGVVEVARRDGISYLSGGTSAGFDIALGPWPSGMDHVAVAVGGREALEEARRRLADANVPAERLAADREPGIEDGVSFALPSGHVVELVLEADPEPYRPTPSVDERHHRGAGPVRLEHVTTDCGDVERTARFLTETFGLRLTESVQPPEAPWFNAFLRCRDRHHDLAFFASPAGDFPSLNHVCFAVPSVEDLVRVADLAAGMGISLDASPGRHLSGNNVFIYLKDPSGTRVEVNTDMAEIDAAAPPRVFEEMRFDAWREGIPPELLTAMPCRDGRAVAATGSR